MKNLIKIQNSLKSKRFKRITGEAFWIISGQVASMIGALFLVKVLTEYLNPFQYGNLALGLTLVNLVNLVFMGTLSSAVSRFYSIADEKNDISGFITSFIKLFKTISIIIFGVGLIGIISFFKLQRLDWALMIFLLIFYSLLSGLNSNLNSIQNAARQRSIVAIHNGLDSWLKIVLAVLMIIYFGSSSIPVILGFLLSSLIINISQYYRLNKLLTKKNIISTKKTNIDWSNDMWRYSWPFMIWGVFGWAQQSSTRWALEIYSSTEDVGMYSVVSQLGYTPIQISIGMVLTFLMPILYARVGDASDSLRREKVYMTINKVAFVGVIITILISIASLYLHEFIFDLLAADDYGSASIYLPIMVLSGGIFGISLLISGRFFANLNASKLLPASIGSSIVGIASAFMCTYFYGILGAVIAMLIHSLSYLVFCLITRNDNKKNLGDMQNA